MRKISIFLFVLISSFVFAQTEQQGIELPDFVITGKQSIDIPIAAKRKPDFIPILSKDFFTPQYSPEELPLLISPEPIPIKPGIKTYDDYFNGSLKVQVGNYSLPVGEFNITQSYDNYLFHSKIWGSNIKEYVANAGYNNSGVSLSNEFFVSTKSDFLPGAKLKLAGEYLRDSYRFFAAKDPTFLRETNGGSAIFSLSSSYNRWITFAADLGGNILSLNESGLKETNFNANGLFEFKTGTITFGLKDFYTTQKLNGNLSGVNGYNFNLTEGYVKLFPTKLFLFTIGINYSAYPLSSFFSPFGSFELNLDKGLTFSVEYKPHVQFYNTKDFLKRNLYFNPGTIDNVSSVYKTNIHGMFKYEYEKMFTVSITGGYAKVNNYFYFEDRTNAGKFDMFILPDANIFSAELNLFFYPAQFGYFFGNVLLKDVKDQFDNNVPYEPKFSSTLSYGYNFNFGLGFNIKYQLALNAYTDIINSGQLADYHNLSISLSYEILKGLKLTSDFQNIFNRANFVWKQYQEEPFDILVGVEYRW